MPDEKFVNHPPHYNRGGIEVIDVIDALGMDFYEGNVFKYLARWKEKNGVEDLKKAKWYLDRLISRNEKSEPNGKDI